MPLVANLRLTPRGTGAEDDEPIPKQSSPRDSRERWTKLGEKCVKMSISLSLTRDESAATPADYIKIVVM